MLQQEELYMGVFYILAGGGATLTFIVISKCFTHVVRRINDHINAERSGENRPFKYRFFREGDRDWKWTHDPEDE